MKGFIPTLIILAACLFSLPASAQVNTLSPEVLDSLYSEVEILVGENIDDQGNVISLGYHPRYYSLGTWIPEVGRISPEGTFPYIYSRGPNGPPCEMMLYSLHQRIKDGNPSEIDVTIRANSQCGVTDSEILKHFITHMYLIVNNDTLHVDKIKFENRHRFTGLDIPLTNENDIAFHEDDILSISIFSKPYYTLQSAPEGELRYWHPVAGRVWISWRIPFLPGVGDYTTNPSNPSEQVRLEKLLGVYYEYRILRDGDKEWKPIFPKDFVLDEVEVTNEFHIAFPNGITRYFQRRKHLVTGLDPNGEYSFCIRAINPAGESEALCNLDVVTPVSVESVELPNAVSLLQNYPNPFNPSTAIEYELSGSEHVRLEVFDAQGRSARVLEDGIRPAGRHSVRFDADGLPSGLYIYGDYIEC